MSGLPCERHDCPLDTQKYILRIGSMKLNEHEILFSVFVCVHFFAVMMTTMIKKHSRFLILINLHIVCVILCTFCLFIYLQKVVACKKISWQARVTFKCIKLRVSGIFACFFCLSCCKNGINAIKKLDLYTLRRET